MWGDSVASVVRPVWVLCQMFGLCNRSIRDKIDVKKPSIFQLAFRYAYNVGVIAVASYCTYSTSDFGITYNKRIVIQLADLLFTLTNNLSMMSAVIFCLIYQDKLARVVVRFNNIDAKLKYFPKLRSAKQVKLTIVVELLFTISLWVLFAFHYIIMQCPFSTVRCLNSWLVIYLSTKISQVFLIQFCTFVVLAKHKILIINDNLEELSRINSTGSVMVEKFVGEIQKVYSEILHCCTDIQTIFSIPLLMKVANQFISLFSSLYFCVFGYVYNGRYINPETFEEFMIPLITTIIAVVEILFAITFCESTTADLRKTGKLIYKIAIPRDNSFLMKRINLFSLQLIHKNFAFTALGFFKIDGALLQTIVGAVTMYLVMFIQFNVATNKDTTTDLKL